MDYLQQHIESLIFSTEQPITLDEIKVCLDSAFETEFSHDILMAAIEQLKQRFAQDVSAIEIVEIAQGYQFLTKGAYHTTIGTYLKQTTKKRLSQAALETLSIIAYKQPISKTDIEEIRGVSSDYSVQKLLEKELITIIGRSDAPGKPLLYATATKFMDYFGLKNLQDLPKLKDFDHAENTIGEPSPIEEAVPSAATEA
ncbi:MAG: SMC-Scp complex subunit ScpB [Saprospiraceae bacterium]|nr:SMC-Scp complex subunit ScpB [Saprospiraceae bacterium]MBP7680165.1 SMC-Scp complex subunit ScpB [Saprospiraceae bacterium]